MGALPRRELRRRATDLTIEPSDRYGPRVNDRSVYVLLIMDGAVIEYPPEVYQDEARARL